VHWASKRHRRALPFLKAGYLPLVVDKFGEFREERSCADDFVLGMFCRVCREWKRGIRSSSAESR
jgi:hypothetical protein